MREALAMLLATLLAACATVPPAPAGDLVTYGSAVSTAVNRYFHYRKLAVVSRDAEILWSRYPSLRMGEDLASGVNTEGWLATRSDTARSLADVVYDLERYDRMRVRVDGDDAVVRVHGLERYIELDFADGTAGEFVLDLYLQRDGEIWTVVRTDEMTLAERHDRMAER